MIVYTIWRSDHSNSAWAIKLTSRQYRCMQKKHSETLPESWVRSTYVTDSIENSIFLNSRSFQKHVHREFWKFNFEFVDSEVLGKSWFVEEKKSKSWFVEKKKSRFWTVYSYYRRFWLVARLFRFVDRLFRFVDRLFRFVDQFYWLFRIVD